MAGILRERIEYLQQRGQITPEGAETIRAAIDEVEESGGFPLLAKKTHKESPSLNLNLAQKVNNLGAGYFHNNVYLLSLSSHLEEKRELVRKFPHIYKFSPEELISPPGIWPDILKQLTLEEKKAVNRVINCFANVGLRIEDVRTKSVDELRNITRGAGENTVIFGKAMFLKREDL